MLSTYSAAPLIPSSKLYVICHFHFKELLDWSLGQLHSVHVMGLFFTATTAFEDLHFTYIIHQRRQCHPLRCYLWSYCRYKKCKPGEDFICCIICPWEKLYILSLNVCKWDAFGELMFIIKFKTQVHEGVAWIWHWSARLQYVTVMFYKFFHPS